jgi:hypothetical protein
MLTWLIIGHLCWKGKILRFNSLVSACVYHNCCKFHMMFLLFVEIVWTICISKFIMINPLGHFCFYNFFIVFIFIQMIIYPL